MSKAKIEAEAEARRQAKLNRLFVQYINWIGCSHPKIVSDGPVMFGSQTWRCAKCDIGLVLADVTVNGPTTPARSVRLWSR